MKKAITPIIMFVMICISALAQPSTENINNTYSNFEHMNLILNSTEFEATANFKDGCTASEPSQTFNETKTVINQINHARVSGMVTAIEISSADPSQPLFTVSDDNVRINNFVLVAKVLGITTVERNSAEMPEIQEYMKVLNENTIKHPCVGTSQTAVLGNASGYKLFNGITALVYKAIDSNVEPTEWYKKLLLKSARKVVKSFFKDNGFENNVYLYSMDDPTTPIKVWLDITVDESFVTNMKSTQPWSLPVGIYNGNLTLVENTAGYTLNISNSQ